MTVKSDTTGIVHELTDLEDADHRQTKCGRLPEGSETFWLDDSDVTCEACLDAMEDPR